MVSYNVININQMTLTRYNDPYIAWPACMYSLGSLAHMCLHLGMGNCTQTKAVFVMLFSQMTVVYMFMTKE